MNGGISKKWNTQTIRLKETTCWGKVRMGTQYRPCVLSSSFEKRAADHEGRWKKTSCLIFAHPGKESSRDRSYFERSQCILQFRQADSWKISRNRQSGRQEQIWQASLSKNCYRQSHSRKNTSQSSTISEKTGVSAEHLSAITSMSAEKWSRNATVQTRHSNRTGLHVIPRRWLKSGIRPICLDLSQKIVGHQCHQILTR